MFQQEIRLTSSHLTLQGQGGPVNSILSWSAWVPLARMSYAIYLVLIILSHLFEAFILFMKVHMTVMAVVSSYDSYRVKVTHVRQYSYSTGPFLYLVIL